MNFGLDSVAEEEGSRRIVRKGPRLLCSASLISQVYAGMIAFPSLLAMILG